MLDRVHAMFTAANYAYMQCFRRSSRLRRPFGLSLNPTKAFSCVDLVNKLWFCVIWFDESHKWTERLKSNLGGLKIRQENIWAWNLELTRLLMKLQNVSTAFLTLFSSAKIKYWCLGKTDNAIQFEPLSGIWTEKLKTHQPVVSVIVKLAEHLHFSPIHQHSINTVVGNTMVVQSITMTDFRDKVVEKSLFCNVICKRGSINFAAVNWETFCIS